MCETDKGTFNGVYWMALSFSEVFGAHCKDSTCYLLLTLYLLVDCQPLCQEVVKWEFSVLTAPLTDQACLEKEREGYSGETLKL